MSLLRFGNVLARSCVKYRFLVQCKTTARATTSRMQLTGLSRQAGFAAADDIDPRRFTNDEWLTRLTPEQYYVCREKGTEEPFTGQYYMHKEEGLYTCICCGTELFSSKAKYDSGSGWPSFFDAIGNDGNNDTSSNVLHRPDNSLGTVRTEVLCKKCDGHLGHVFTDGPEPTGNRYCINSTALKFTPKKLSST